MSDFSSKTVSHVINQQRSLSINKKLVDEIVQAFLKVEKQKADEVFIYFVNKKKISELHRQFFDDPTPTDCISFPFDSEGEENKFLGEVIVCPQVALEYAEQHGKDPYEETTLYIIHGLLHLVGYDDIEEKQKSLMRKAERKHLTHLHKKGLILR